LSDFEVTDEEEEEDIFTESEENVLRQEREETCKWYQSWDGCDAIMTQMTCPQIMRHLTV